MRPGFAAVFVVPFLFSHPSAAPRHILSLSAPELVQLPAGSTASFAADVVLASEGLTGDEGAQGWSVSVSVAGGKVVGATTSGTVAAARDDTPPGIRTGGFEWTEVTDGPGNGGAVTAVVLSIEEDVTLPPNSADVVLRLTVEAIVPEPVVDDNGDPSCDPLAVRLFFEDGQRGSGGPVHNEVSYRAQPVRPEFVESVTRVCPDVVAPVVFRRGDSNCDGSVDLSDAVFVFKFLFGGREPCCMDAADAADEGTVAITSGIFILNFLFQEGPEIPAPYRRCGLDSSDDPQRDCEYPPESCR